MTSRATFSCAAWVFTAGALISSAAGAATFTVNPTQVTLKAGQASAMIALKNESDAPLRVQLTAFHWDQDARGEMILLPTDDVVVFPKMVTLAAAEARNVRVGITASRSPVERTYRLFLEELPGSRTAGAAAVTMRMRLSIPVFVAPVKASAAAATDGLTIENGALSLRIENRGTVHFVPTKITVAGMNASGVPVFTKDVPGWYILAGHSQTFSVALTPDECAATYMLHLDVRIGASTLHDESARPASGCVITE